jgi:hypothetical protein
MPWMRSKEKAPSTNTKKVIHPIFEQAAQLAEDPFWKAEMENAARGRFPRGFMYRDGIISYKKGNKIFPEKVPQENALFALHTTVRFFQEKGKIRSKRDKEKEERIKREKEENHVQRIQSWKDIRKETVKEQYLNDYVDRVCDEHDLDDESRKRLLSLLHFGLSLGYLKNDDIALNENGTRIENIAPLRFVDEETGFSLDVDEKSKPKAKTETISELVDPSFTFRPIERTHIGDVMRKYLAQVQRTNNKKNARIAQDPEPVQISDTRTLSAEDNRDMVTDTTEGISGENSPNSNQLQTHEKTPSSART